MMPKMRNTGKKYGMMWRTCSMQPGQSLLPSDVQQISMGRLLPIRKISPVTTAGHFFHKLIYSKQYHLFLLWELPLLFALNNSGYFAFIHSNCDVSQLLFLWSVLYSVSQQEDCVCNELSPYSISHSTLIYLIRKMNIDMRFYFWV